MSAVSFGTDGWRGKIGENFTASNVRRAAAGLARALRPQSRVAVGWDTRFGSAYFAEQAARVLAAQGHSVSLAERFSPTPALTWAVAGGGYCAAVMITASHNPPTDNGFKIKTAPGVSAPGAFTKKVEKLIPNSDPAEKKALPPTPKTVDFVEPYLALLRRRIAFRHLRRWKENIVFDAFGGAAARHFEKLIGRGSLKVETLFGEPHPLFWGRTPEPVKKNLSLLLRVVREKRAFCGLAVDGDADRIALVDEKGRLVPIHWVHALLLHHLVERLRKKGAVVRTVSGTQMLDAMAQAYGLPVVVTPVGFKYIAEEILRQKVVLGAEESGGIAVQHHLPERDGLFLAGLLLEALHAWGLPVSRVLEKLRRRFGMFFYDRVDLPAPPGRTARAVLDALRKNPPDRLGGLAVRRVDRRDGLLLLFPQAWVLFRASGTEPLWRVYAETPSPAQTKRLLQAACRLLERIAPAGLR